MDNKLQEYQWMIRKLEHENSEAHTEVEGMKQDLAVVIKQMQMDSQRLKQVEHENEEFRQHMKQLLEKYEVLQAQHGQVRAANQKLQSALESRGDYDALKVSLVAALKQNTQSGQIVHEHQEEQERFNKVMTELTANNTQLHQDLAAQKQLKEQVEAERDHLVKTVEELKGKVMKYKKLGRAAAAPLDEERKTMKSELDRIHRFVEVQRQGQHSRDYRDSLSTRRASDPFQVPDSAWYDVQTQLDEKSEDLAAVQKERDQLLSDMDAMRGSHKEQMRKLKADRDSAYEDVQSIREELAVSLNPNRFEPHQDEMALVNRRLHRDMVSQQVSFNKEYETLSRELTAMRHKKDQLVSTIADFKASHYEQVASLMNARDSAKRKAIIAQSERDRSVLAMGQMKRKIDEDSTDHGLMYKDLVSRKVQKMRDDEEFLKMRAEWIVVTQRLTEERDRLVKAVEDCTIGHRKLLLEKKALAEEVRRLQESSLS